MKVSYNWLSELLVGLNADVRELSKLITMKTAECEGVEPVGAHFAKVVAARVVSAEAIEGTHLHKAIIDAGDGVERQLVCGAPNCRAGIITAYVPAGTVLGGREIGRIKLHGVDSEGMLASAAELGIGSDHDGIMELTGVEPGQPLPGCTSDNVIEIDNKSVTHRPDLWGHYGFAREVAAIMRLEMRDPVRTELVPEGPSPISVEVADDTLCPRYSALVFESVTVAPSPLWLQLRLKAIGLNPINNIVDVTNFVMAELAQPMHAFDADRVEGSTIYVRPARADEKLEALNGVTYTLDANNLVIADAAGPIAVAGVIGGQHSSINGETRRIVLESAVFNASSVRKTSSSLKLRTDASMRFEKAQDPANTLRAMARAIELLQQVAPGIRFVGGLVEKRRVDAPAAPITLSLDWLDRKLGKAIPAAEVRDILERLEFKVSEPEPRVFSVEIPSWRATKDVSIPADLVEEVGRMVGYVSIPPQPPLVPTKVTLDDAPRLFQRSVRLKLAAQGFTEVCNYSFVSDEQARELGMDPDAHVRIANPIAAGQTMMRSSLVPGVLKNIRDNSKHFDSFRLFEVGREIHKQPTGLPEETPHVAAVYYQRDAKQTGLYELKRVAECLMPGCEFTPAEARVYEHPTRCAELHWRGQILGRLFEFHPSIVDVGRAVVLDVDLEKMLALSESKTRYSAVRRFPSSFFDLSVLAASRDLVGDLQKKIAALAGTTLEKVEYIGQYIGAPIPEGRKSVSFRLHLAAQDHTLSLDEINAVRRAVIDGLAAEGFELRA